MVLVFSYATVSIYNTKLIKSHSYVDEMKWYVENLLVNYNLDAFCNDMQINFSTNCGSTYQKSTPFILSRK